MIEFIYQEIEKMKAWFVSDDVENFGVLVHAKTRGQAKVAGHYEMDVDFIHMRSIRVPQLDDKPFTLENVNSAQFFTSWDDDPGMGYSTEDGFFLREDEWYNSCQCDICKGIKNAI